jgi:tetratricopeptide (TPR) repeat protein
MVFASEKRNIIILALLLIAYSTLIPPFTGYMKSKPIVEKLGNFPRVEVLQFVAADQKQLFAASLVMKVMIYFGGLMEDESAKYKIPPDFNTMSRVLHGSVKLDPYNMDAYYFAQGILVWDIGIYKVANDLLDYGMKYRTWDWYLPFFAGFNAAYFLKDYQGAARYYQTAAELSGNALFSTLAGRYMQKSGKTVMALAYLETMEKSAKNPAVKTLYATRVRAFKAVRDIEVARDQFVEQNGHLPASPEALAMAGFLEKIPVDPYGGKFYFESDGTVNTTSQFSFVKK